MKLNLEAIEKVANLAHLELTQDEKESYRNQISAILNYVESLNSVSTEGVEPLVHAVVTEFVLRDEKEFLPDLKPEEVQSMILANCKDVEDGGFRVPQVV